MNDKKHIDRLFQEKFKDFEMKPNVKVWSKIEAQLQKPKRKKRIIPIWLQYGGVAALLVLFLGIGNSFLNSNDVQNNTIVTTKNKDSIRNSTLKNNITNVIKNTENNTSLSNIYSKNKETNPIKEKKALKSSKNKYKNSSNLHTESHNINTSAIANTKKAPVIKNNIAVVSVSETGNYNAKNATNTKRNANKQNKATLYAQNSIKKNAVSATNKTLITTKKNATNLKKSNTNTTISNTEIAMINSEKKDTKNEDENSTNSAESIEETIAKIEALKKEVKASIKEEKWSVNANIAPVYYNTLGKGSHIHDQFIDNEKDGEINTSYGLKVGYALNKKLKIRSGINKLDLSYDTANVVVYTSVSNSPNISGMRNIKFAPDTQGQTFAVLSRDNLKVIKVSNIVANNLNAALSQRISYLEVPLEMEYALVNSKLGVNLIGGASAFILSNNEMVSEINNIRTKIGEANNINSFSYSANIGLGIDYKFSKSLKFNLEPTFKYQMNAYNETSGDFRPYIIGVYTGLSFKF